MGVPAPFFALLCSHLQTAPRGQGLAPERMGVKSPWEWGAGESGGLGILTTWFKLHLEP